MMSRLRLNPDSFIRHTIAVCMLIVACYLPAGAQAQQFEALEVDDDTEVTLSIYPAQGQRLLIWFPSYATPVETVSNIAGQLQALGIEVWYADLLEARFLPKAASSIYKIANQDILAVLAHATRTRDKKVFIYAESRSTIPVLHALRKKQLSPSGLPSFAGLLLNSPYFYVETPDPGEEAQLRPIVRATNLPVYILQPEYSPRYWQLQQTIPALEQGGSDVFVQVLRKMRGRFHFRPDASDDEIAFSHTFGKMIDQGMRLLATVNSKPRKVTAQSLQRIEIGEGKKDRYLQVYQGNPAPPPLRLPSLKGDTIDLQKLNNQVVLVNFWASWCPPCVHEMPSMQRLSEKLLGDPFVILGVNIAEEKSVVESFLQRKVNVDFPILLDSKGDMMRQWGVMAFPTSFVVDKKGKIRYALFGSIDWNTPEIINKIDSLVKED